MGTPELALQAEPVRWLGAPAPGGLALPPARAGRRTLYAPRGVYLDDRVVAVADSGNHRVLLWYGWPKADHQPADVVLGHTEFEAEGPGLLHLPTAVALVEGRLLVADAWHHRILVWDGLPEGSGQPPDRVIGQPDLRSTAPNAGGSTGPAGFYWPYGFAYVHGWFYVADTGNRRVLGWRGVPEGLRPADLVLGQPDAYSGAENRGRGVGADTFRWPHALAGDGTTLYVADAGNHRVLGFTPPPEQDRPADLVLGQEDFDRDFELPHVPQGPRRLRFPYGVALCRDYLAVADTANNRVLLFPGPPRRGVYLPAAHVIGQANFAESGENRWRAVGWDTLCWPYGVWGYQDLLAVADSGNNRVMIWRLRRS
ncbi:NHL repeat containing protein (plasmid) [Thermus thermophilus SG0.5JP17-16]|uniref:NHL repeat containing protein n=1 Tax=Thermus thermophilus (strain SG0.5JP17-16) TaxID=762633 RepID=F6DIR6_THETG|nr:NHL repeat-containing protein [Thermus thermophilus]AEG34732.1 NHL repeat containing protein [Thermus thermophilus SG0.5JP17-16]